MTNTTVEWPKKTRELQNHHMDSTRWNGFKFRDGDIVVATWAKSGTTWMQQIISQLVFQGADQIASMDTAPWVDLRVIPLEEVVQAVEAQQHRRSLKTHLPVDAPVLFAAREIHLHRSRRPRHAMESVQSPRRVYRRLLRRPQQYAGAGRAFAPAAAR